MINLFDSYGIDTEERNFILTKEITRKARKGGGQEVCNKPIGYYSNLKNALTGLMQKVQKQKLQEKDYTFREAVELINDIEKNFEKLLEQIKENMLV